MTYFFEFCRQKWQNTPLCSGRTILKGLIIHISSKLLWWHTLKYIIFSVPFNPKFFGSKRGPGIISSLKIGNPGTRCIAISVKSIFSGFVQWQVLLSKLLVLLLLWKLCPKVEKNFDTFNCTLRTFSNSCGQYSFKSIVKFIVIHSLNQVLKIRENFDENKADNKRH